MSKPSAYIGRHNGYPALYLTNLTETERNALYKVMFENNLADTTTNLRSEAGAFVLKWFDDISLYTITLRGDDIAAHSRFIASLEGLLSVEFHDTTDVDLFRSI